MRFPSAILVIGGSVRPRRRSPAIAQWVAELGGVHTGHSFRTVDLKTPDLTDQEPAIPAMNAYTLESTKRWSAEVAAAPAVVFVTPQYNWGYPAALKNAIDHLYREWADKPALIVTYGSQGGGKCAAQLREVLIGLHMRLVEAMPGLKLSRARIEANDAEVDPDTDFAEQRAEVIDALRQLSLLCPKG